MAIARNGHNGVHGTLYPGHFCPTCGFRVMPGTMNESVTIAPQLGKRGEPILLSTLNGYLSRENPGDPSRLAYCFNCKEWVNTKRKSVLEVRYEYVTRAGVSFRFPDGHTAEGSDRRAKTIITLINARAEGAGTIVRAATPSPKKRRR